MSSPSKRREMDVMKLMMSDHIVEPINDGINEFTVEFHGPKESPYEGGVWKVRVKLPDAYPYKSPSIRFLSKIYHPNVNELCGSVCLDVINQSWSPIFGCCEECLDPFVVAKSAAMCQPCHNRNLCPLCSTNNIVDGEDQKQYEQKVKEYCERYAKRVNINNNAAEESSDEDISDGESTLSDNEVAGHPDPSNGSK